MRLDEKALRRDAFEDGYAVTLADGQEWTIPPVRFRFFPGDDGSFRGRPWYGGDLEDELDILFGVVEPPDGMVMPFVQIPIKIAAALLRKNYDLPPRSAASLLSYVPGDDASEAMLARITRAVLGRDPDAVDEDDEEPDDPKGGGASDATPTSDGSS